MENATDTAPTQLSLQDQIALRIKTAKDKQIYQKAVAVAIKHGDHTQPSYRDDGITFYDDQWKFIDEEFSVRSFESCCGHTTSVGIYMGKKMVFHAEAKIDSSHIFGKNPEERVETYIPGADWEQWLDQLAAPMIDQFRKAQEAEVARLKERYGL